MKQLILIISILFPAIMQAQSNASDSVRTYKKRVLESAEIDFLTSYYSQDGDNAAVSGGIGTEHLTDATGTIVVSIPLNADDVLTIDAGISAYTSASSSNIGPFDARNADPFQASSGASKSDTWTSGSASYTHNSNDRNAIWSAKLSLATEYDYFSIGTGGSYTRLFNEKNTEVSVHASVYFDRWSTIYPTELRPFGNNGNGLNNGLFTRNTITGNENYNPQFTEFTNKNRNSYAIGLRFSQILSKNIQGSLAFDLIYQEGLLSTPFQRVYFADVADSYIDNFQLADANEILPDTRLKLAFGGRLHYYINEVLTTRTFYRFYQDDWGITSHTASIELPVKVSDKFTLYPSFRYYQQNQADYFSPYETALSSDAFYTSDYDLSDYSATQFGFGISYTDIFTKAHIGRYGLKSIDVKYYVYDRNTTFGSSIITAGLKFVVD